MSRDRPTDAAGRTRESGVFRRRDPVRSLGRRREVGPRRVDPRRPAFGRGGRGRLTSVRGPQHGPFGTVRSRSSRRSRGCSGRAGGSGSDGRGRCDRRRGRIDGSRHGSPGGPRGFRGPGRVDRARRRRVGTMPGDGRRTPWLDAIRVRAGDRRRRVHSSKFGGRLSRGSGRGTSNLGPTGAGRDSADSTPERRRPAARNGTGLRRPERRGPR